MQIIFVPVNDKAQESIWAAMKEGEESQFAKDITTLLDARVGAGGAGRSDMRAVWPLTLCASPCSLIAQDIDVGRLVLTADKKYFVPAYNSEVRGALSLPHACDVMRTT